ncbi:GNAT family N-acetyltransferase [Peterkaempfera sp. SMS 1(5)a]|uniref:GNAT family N-acetyltransferase n=1 Tax=Peterkaempfera podocarpi TaxID=3232308 RepID=UPI00366F8306
MDIPPDWTVTPAPAGGAEAADLLRRYYTDIVGRYYGREAQPHEVDEVLRQEPSRDLDPPTGVFLVGRFRTLTAGCVGVRLLTPEIAELTRLWIAPVARGTGGGPALLAAAEQAAVRMGRRTMRLDTRRDLVEARALYARHGYAEIPAYNRSPYADHWFEKALG